MQEDVDVLRDLLHEASGDIEVAAAFARSMAGEEGAGNVGGAPAASPLLPLVPGAARNAAARPPASLPLPIRLGGRPDVATQHPADR